MRALNLFFAICLLLSPLSSARAEEMTFPTDTLAIKTHDATLHYTVEVATSEEQQHQGLMFRKSLPKMHGMIFVMSHPRQVTFWMKNTPLPLDMLFIDNKGIVAQIKENATPESTDQIASAGEVRAVLELKGGAAAQYHIAPGDKVIYSLFP